MRIAVCDDEPLVSKRLCSEISSGSAALGANADVLAFNKGEELLDAHRSEPFDAVFLDIDMPQPDGFALAEAIGGEKTLIVFVTDHDELVYSSLRFRPFRFVRKSHLDEELPEVLEAVSKELSRLGAGRKFMLRTINGEIYLDIADIQYIEIFGHTLRVQMNNGESAECSGSLSELEKQLSEFDFVRTHKSYLVNCKYIYAIESRQVILDDQTAVPLSRYKADAVREKFKRSFGGAR